MLVLRGMIATCMDLPGSFAATSNQAIELELASRCWPSTGEALQLAFAHA